MSDSVILSDVAELVMGQSPPSTSYNDAGDGLPFYQGKTDFGATFPTPRIYCREPKKIAQEGDILMSVRAPVGATNLCGGESCIGRGIAAIRARGIDRDFLYFYLKKIEGYIDSLGSGAIFKAINKSQLAELPINDAGIPLPEQKKIAHILSTVQRAIEAQERIIQTTTELKKALMHKLFTEGLRNEPQKQTEIGPVPESWEVKTVGDVTAVKGGKRLPKGEKLVEKDTGFPYIRVTDFEELSVNQSDLLYLTEKVQNQISRYIIKADNVFISIAGSIGFPGMIPPELDGANLTENAARLIVNDASELQPRFLMYWLASHHCQAEIKAQTVKNAQPKLALARIKSLGLPIPSLDEQAAVAAALDLAGDKTATARTKKAQLQDLFRTLLHELMTAKTRVHELELSA